MIRKTFLVKDKNVDDPNVYNAPHALYVEAEENRENEGERSKLEKCLDHLRGGTTIEEHEIAVILSSGYTKIEKLRSFRPEDVPSVGPNAVYIAAMVRDAFHTEADLLSDWLESLHRETGVSVPGMMNSQYVDITVDEKVS